MQIAGLQKTTLVDFPGKVATTVFTRGCSFRCPFCHNPELVIPEKFNSLISIEGFFDFLEKRQGKIQGVCVTGGEPLLHSDIDKFIARIKKMGFAVKLDTNGSFPERLEKLISDRNIDYIAMDIKAPLDKYPEVAKIKSNVISNPFDFAQGRLSEKSHGSSKLINNIKKSIDLIMNSDIDYEFRTTVCHPIHDVADFDKIGKLIKGAKRYYIQNFVHSKHNDETINFKPFTDRELQSAKDIIQKYVINTSIR